MKWYKRDPDAAMVGMCGLSDEQYRAYNTFLDLFFSRDGNVTDYEIISHLPWNQQRWVRVRDELIALGKLQQIGKKLEQTRALSELKLAKKRIESTQLARQKALEIKATPSLLTDGQPQPQPERKKEDRSSTRKRVSPRTQFPEDWKPELTGEQSLEFENFKGWALAKGAIYSNWPQAWANWWRNRDKFNRGGTNGGRTTGQVLDGRSFFSAEAVAERAWRRQRSGHSSPASGTRPAIMAGRPLGACLGAKLGAAISGDGGKGESS